MHPASGLIALQHGRDQLHDNWPERFTVKQNAELPAEVMVRPTQGADYGWPYCYYDGRQSRYFLAPEYGGDGKKTDRCPDKASTEAAYPGHWAPNGLAFYSGSAFPARYRGAPLSP